jgi:hypothetical protein
MKSACLAILASILVTAAGCADRVLEPRMSAARVALDAQAATAEHGRLRRPFRILFIGNSLTYVNDLPAMVEGISRAAGDDPPLETEMVALPAYSLEDHLAEGSAVRAIERGDWDVVALSQGPSTLPESRANLIQYTRIFAAKIRAVSARPALYGVWPEEERLYALPWGIASYRAAAEEVDGLLFPAGLAWQAAWRTDPRSPCTGRTASIPRRSGPTSPRSSSMPRCATSRRSACRERSRRGTARSRFRRARRCSPSRWRRR